MNIKLEVLSEGSFQHKEQVDIGVPGDMQLPTFHLPTRRLFHRSFFEEIPPYVREIRRSIDPE